MSLKIISGAALAALLIAGAAQAQDPATVAATRHHNFHQINDAFKGIRDEVQKPAPSIAVLQSNAKALDDLASKVPTWFPAGTGRDVVPKSEALPVIWQKPDEFKAAAGKLASAAHAMNVAAMSGSVDAVKGAIPALGGACKNCHETFKARDEH